VLDPIPLAKSWTLVQIAYCFKRSFYRKYHSILHVPDFVAARLRDSFVLLDIWCYYRQA
jgi:hypothetical protein